MDKRQKLKNLIEKLRGKMIESAQTKGLNHPKTIRISQRLDNLISEFQKIK